MFRRPPRPAADGRRPGRIRRAAGPPTDGVAAGPCWSAWALSGSRWPPSPRWLGFTRSGFSTRPSPSTRRSLAVFAPLSSPLSRSAVRSSGNRELASCPARVARGTSVPGQLTVVGARPSSRRPAVNCGGESVRKPCGIPMKGRHQRALRRNATRWSRSRLERPSIRTRGANWTSETVGIGTSGTTWTFPDRWVDVRRVEHGGRLELH